MKKIFLGILVGALISEQLPSQWLDLLPGGKQDNRHVFIKVLILVRLQRGNINALSESKEELR